MKNFEKANQRNSRAALIQQILDEIHLTPFTYLKEYLKTTRCQKLANNGYTNLEGKSSICFEFRSNRLTKIVKFLDRKIAKKEEFFDFFTHNAQIAGNISDANLTQVSRKPPKVN